MEPHRDDIDLTAALRSLRTTPRPEFSAELDARVAAGFPRRGGEGKAVRAGIAQRLRGIALPRITLRRALVPAGALALTAIVIATAVVVTSEDVSSPERSLLSGGERLEQPAPEASKGPAAAGADRSSSGAAGAPGSTQYSDSSGPFASQAGRRRVERAAQLVLATDATGVRGAASEVFEAVHANDGIVLRSSINDDGDGEASARFDLLIPSGKLSNALAAFSEIGEVRSRHESSADITAPTISVGEGLRDSRARVEGLLGQLAGATTETERATAEAELRAERRRLARLRSRLATLQRRANFSRVSLRIESGAASEGSGAPWGVGDALEDAGHILAVGAGVMVVGLAVVGPLALILLGAWLARRAWVRRSREAALG